MTNRKETSQIIVHCAATKPHQDIGAKEIKRWHADPKPQGRGWSDIGYHYVIRRDGELELGRDLMAYGAHAKGHNHNSVAVCLVGGINYQGEPDFNFTQRQLLTLFAVLTELVQKFPGAEVKGHRDLPDVSKACPGFDVGAWFGLEQPLNHTQKKK